MPQYPFIANYGSGNFGLGRGRDYYGPSLSDPKTQPPLWRADRQDDFYQDLYGSSGFVYAGLGVAGFAALGAAPFRKGRVADLYTSAARVFEEYSPVAMGRTFQLSSFLSQFETATTKGFEISGELLRANTVQREYLSKLIGMAPVGASQTTAVRLQSAGVELRGGKLLWRDTGEVALPFAKAMRVTPGAHSRLGAMWARMVGMKDQTLAGQGDDLAHYFASINPKPFDFTVKNPLAEGMPAQIIGGKSKLQFLGRSVSAWGGEFVDRFNRLLEAPFAIEPFQTIFGGTQKFIQTQTGRLGRYIGYGAGEGVRLKLGVERGTGLQMLGRLGAKYGFVLPAIAMAYKTVDWQMRESEMLDDTLFEEGLTYGIATVGVKAKLLATETAYGLGLNKYREKQEEIAPGSTSLQKLAAFPLMGGLFGAGTMYGMKIFTPKGLLSAIPEGGMISRQLRLGETAGEAKVAVEEGLKQFGKGTQLGRLATRLTTETGFYKEEGTVGNIIRRLAQPGKAGTDELKFKLLGKMGPAKLLGVGGALLGTAAILPFLPGALIPEKSPEELRAIYSGEQDVAVRAGRWWEFGRSEYEGRRVSYHRPHWYAMMKMRAKEKQMWGDEASELSPFRKWLKSEFTYDLEKKHYEDRPYPVSSVPFEDVPLIGPILAGTIGRLIKPPVLMHEEEWISGKGVLDEPSRFGQRVATEIGQEPGGIPESPFGAKGIIGEQIYRLQEMGGLYGFAMMTAQEKLKGTPDIFDQFKQLESSRRMSGFEREYWDWELGGLLGVSEAFRRLYPHRRRQIPLYNPIRNEAPDWLPGPGDKSPDFLHGDQYIKVPMGEIRLPGAGYEARYPELEGVDPEDYPLIHKLKILSDVAPYSDKYGEHLNLVRRARKSSYWSNREEDLYQQTMKQLKERKQGKEFEEYRYLSSMGEIFGEDTYWSGEDSAGLLSQLNKIKASQKEKPSLFGKLFGGYWELLAHNAETALDQLTPVSPGSKLVHVRTPIESYERLQVYGTENAFWNHPVRDFFRPSLALGAEAVGFDEIPEHIQQRRQVEELFDRLKYVKFTRLANIARLEKDFTAAKEFEAKKDQTLFGINPYTYNYTSIFRSLPRRDRDYFNSFSEAETEAERKRILELVPEGEKSLYVARWKLAFANEVRQAKKAGLLTDQQLEEADSRVREIYDEAGREGFPSSKELLAEYWETRYPGESYADWYRRIKLLGGLESIPGPDWVGFHPSVSLEDIKLKLVTNMGADMHDYDLWPSQAQTLVNKPWINDEAIEAISEPEKLNRSEIHDRINELFLTDKMRASVFSRSTYSPIRDDSIDIEIRQEGGRKGRLF